MEQLSQLAWIDLLGLGLIGTLAILGIARGLWWQAIRLVGLLAAVLVARSFGPDLQTVLTPRLSDLSPRIVYGLSWLLVFLASLTLVAFLGTLGKKLLETMQLGLVDRLGGALAGVLTGLFLHAALLAGLCQLGEERWVAGTLEDTASLQLIDSLGRRWPVVLAKDASDQLGGILGGGPDSPTQD